MKRHCDNPTCSQQEVEDFEWNEIVVVVNGKNLEVRGLCNSCLGSFVQDIRTHPHFQRIVTVTGENDASN